MLHDKGYVLLEKFFWILFFSLHTNLGIYHFSHIDAIVHKSCLVHSRS